MPLNIKWFSKSKEEKEAEHAHQVELTRLRRQKELRAAELEASEVDEDVITLNTRLRLVKMVADMTEDLDQQNELLMTLGRDLGIEQLAAHKSAQKQMELLKELTDEDFKKMEKAIQMEREKMLVGFDGMKEKKRGYRAKKLVDTEVD